MDRYSQSLQGRPVDALPKIVGLENADRLIIKNNYGAAKAMTILAAPWGGEQIEA